MYPLRSTAPFAREQWYVAGTADEFGRTLRSRTILGEPLVMFRSLEGEPVVLWGLCPHRLMPLALGQLDGDRLVCGYHGFEFAIDGNCVRIPTSGKVPARCNVKAYSVVERGPFVWIWMGKGPADQELLPDASDIGLGAEAGEWRADPLPSQYMKARAQLLIDNLLDLSHLGFVHAKSVPGETLPFADASVEDDGSRLRVIRVSKNGPGGPTMEWLMPGAAERVWTELTAVVYNPCLINTYGPWAWNVNPDGSQGKRIGRMNFIHAVTPESANTTHYFGAQSRDFRLADDELSAALVHQNMVVRGEDIVALEAIERFADQFGDWKRETSITTDAGALRWRRRMEELIAAEQSGPAT